ncbi:hypothetical protein CFE53_06445 [Methanofervidicoccus sp. A16]|uniref:hypothetical protein n=1 Tax=Methanofervidicoccus sp. A16 TaxID=2607662 RepID=UPI001187FA80|nr:hypothetical protein [Methanofervidicoccus sp. A16]AXI25777.1 hypothetical protein CFE53_06445 [Methanofervidicoccus sp. A16]
MKKFTILLIIFTILPLSLAWNDCSYGITNSSCHFPGYCSRYIDTNNNNICDHSEPAPESIGDPRGEDTNASESKLSNNSIFRNDDQDEKPLIDKIIEFLFIEVDLKEVLLSLLEGVFR